MKRKHIPHIPTNAFCEYSHVGGRDEHERNNFLNHNFFLSKKKQLAHRSRGGRGIKISIRDTTHTYFLDWKNVPFLSLSSFCFSQLNEKKRVLKVQSTFLCHEITLLASFSSLPFYCCCDSLPSFEMKISISFVTQKRNRFSSGNPEGGGHFGERLLFFRAWFRAFRDEKRGGIFHWVNLYGKNVFDDN